MHLDFHLALGRYAVEATSTGITLNVDDAQTVAGILANALEGRQQTLVVELHLKLLSLVAELLLILLCFRYYLVQLTLLLIKNVLAVSKVVSCNVDIGMLLLNLAREIVDFLLSKLNVEVLILDFL